MSLNYTLGNVKMLSFIFVYFTKLKMLNKNNNTYDYKIINKGN